MGKFLFAVVGLVVGLLGGAFVGGSLMGGTAAGVGIATGLSAGICSTLTAAKAEGLLTDEQIEQVLARAATDLGGSDFQDGATVNSASECEAVMERLREAASQ